MKEKSWIVTLVAASALAGVLVAPALPGTAGAAGPAWAQVQPGATWPPAGTAGRRDVREAPAQSPPQRSYHADYHADYRVGVPGERDARQDEARDGRRDRPPGHSERYTRPPLGWRR